MKVLDRVGGITAVKIGLYIRDFDLWVIDQNFGSRHSLFDRGWAVLFKRVARGYNPPDFIKIKPLDRFACDMRMPFVGGIKRPSEQADDLTLSGVWEAMAHLAFVAQVSGVGESISDFVFGALHRTGLGGSALHGLWPIHPRGIFGKLKLALV